MTYASNGAAIIGTVLVPASEVLVLQTLFSLAKPATVPQIALALNEKLSDASLYTLLGWLKKRGLVTREEVMLEPTDDRCGGSSGHFTRAPSAFSNVKDSTGGINDDLQASSSTAGAAPEG